MNLLETPPIMPDDWWPDSVIVMGKTRDGEKSYELGFAITESTRDHLKESIDVQLHVLRRCL